VHHIYQLRVLHQGRDERDCGYQALKNAFLMNYACLNGNHWQEGVKLALSNTFYATFAHAFGFTRGATCAHGVSLMHKDEQFFKQHLQEVRSTLAVEAGRRIVALGSSQRVLLPKYSQVANEVSRVADYFTAYEQLPDAREQAKVALYITANSGSDLKLLRQLVRQCQQEQDFVWSVVLSVDTGEAHSVALTVHKVGGKTEFLLCDSSHAKFKDTESFKNAVNYVRLLALGDIDALLARTLCAQCLLSIDTLQVKKAHFVVQAVNDLIKKLDHVGVGSVSTVGNYVTPVQERVALVDRATLDQAAQKSFDEMHGQLKQLRAQFPEVRASQKPAPQPTQKASSKWRDGGYEDLAQKLQNPPAFVDQKVVNAYSKELEDGLSEMSLNYHDFTETDEEGRTLKDFAQELEGKLVHNASDKVNMDNLKDVLNRIKNAHRWTPNHTQVRGLLLDFAQPRDQNKVSKYLEMIAARLETLKKKGVDLEAQDPNDFRLKDYALEFFKKTVTQENDPSWIKIMGLLQIKKSELPEKELS